MNNYTAKQNCTFDLFHYFQGNTHAWGIFEDRFGNLKRSFSVRIIGVCQNNKLTLTEKFHYSDGIEETRVWIIQRDSSNNYTADTGDACDIAVGSQHSNYFKWHYKMKLSIGEKKYKVVFNDKLYPIDQSNVFNRATISKWGITLGTVSLFFKKI